MNITDLQQPLLSCKVQRGRGGVTENCYLVPELCRETGLSDTMRGDFKLMMELGK